MPDPTKNFAIADVSTGYDSDDTSIVLESGHGAHFPDPATDGAFNLVWWNFTDYPNPAEDPNREIVRVTAVSTDTLTVIRAMEGTTASTKNEADKDYKMVLAITTKEAEQNASRVGDYKEERTHLGQMHGSFSTNLGAGGKQRVSIGEDGTLIVDDTMEGDAANFLNLGDGAFADGGSARSSICLSPDGLRAYYYTNETLYQYDLSVAWDVSTAVLDDSVALTAIGAYQYSSLRFRPDGKKLYIGYLSGSPYGIEEYTLTTPWDITAGIASDGVHTIVAGLIGYDISPDGRHLLLIRNASSTYYLRHYLIRKPWDLSTLVQDGSEITLAGIDIAFGVCYHPSGMRAYIPRAFSADCVINIIEFTKPFDWSTATLGGDLDYGTAASGYADVFVPHHGRSIYRSHDDGVIQHRSLYTDQYLRHKGGVTSTKNLTVRSQATIADAVVTGQLAIGTSTFSTAKLRVNNDANPRASYSDTLAHLIGGGGKNHLLIDMANDVPMTIYRHSTGTMGSPAATQSGNFMGGMRAYGYDGSAFALQAQFMAAAGNTWDGSNRGTEFWWYTTAPNSTSMGARMVLDGYGRLGVGDLTPVPKFEVAARFNALADVADSVNYLQVLRYDAAVTGNGAGLGFSVTYTDNNIGAAIIHRRTNSNSQGTLEFYTKRVTTGGAGPELAMTIEETGDILLEENMNVKGTIKGLIGINEQTGTSYTLALTDKSFMIDANNADPFTLTVPPEASVAFDIGTKILIRQKGAGAVTINPDTGVTVDTSLTLVVNGQNAIAGIIKVAADTWVAMGDLVAS